ncbi:unnamed protein product [Spirodela intermedia]|uniref:THH1/TOM1/TOM3 domain-containing protein n=1 Tax=Spirodela intermedia TaxID=51605 RepID=A0A7I8KW45_SPIIN|nr:unnamed protein product [Spirodela intermedia]
MLRAGTTGASAAALESRHTTCPSPATFAVDSILAFVDGSIAIVAFSQLLRIHLCNRQLGWTRQKIFHLMIGSSNIGFLLYFTSTLLATCNGWPCWSHGCGFILIACPQILFLASFLLLLSFWVDLCHQASDEDDEEYDSSTEALLEKTENEAGSSHVDTRRRFCSFCSSHIGNRQKFVILVIVLTFLFMIAFAMLIWFGKGKNPIDSSLMARVYLDIFSVAIFTLGGALACYGGLLFSKMSKVRSEMASTEMWKVASLAAVTLVCFTSSALIALISNVPVLYDYKPDAYKRSTPIPLFLYYFFGSTLPSVFVLWIMREMPRQVIDRETRSRVVTFVRERSSSKHHPQPWTSATTSTNQASRASPI